jgi:hypothetical protein
MSIIRCSSIEPATEREEFFKNKIPATVKVASRRASPGIVEAIERSKANAEMAISRFFFLSNLLMDRKSNLEKKFS